MTLCLTCQKGTLHEKPDVEYTQEIAGHTFTTPVPARICDHCGDIEYQGAVLEHAELLWAKALALSGEVSGAVFRFLRSAVGLRAVDLAQLLDLKPETLSRWENGRTPVDKAALAILAQIVLDEVEGRSLMLDRLRALRAPSPLPGQVTLPLS